MAPYSYTTTQAKRDLQSYPQKDDHDENEKRIVAALALRSFHLPGYTLLPDWWQYMVNQHPVLGICCHHRLHPLELKMRFLYCFGSVMFGLAVTNCMWLAFIWGEVDQNQAFLTIQYGEEQQQENGINNELYDHNNNNFTIEEETSRESNGLLFQNNGEIIITQGMILLWTVGGTLHALFDQTIWFITTCVCCLPGQPLECCLFARQYSRYLAVLAVIMATAIATLAVLLRASLEVDESELPSSLSSTDRPATLEDLYYQTGQRIDQIQEQSITAYDFLLTYGIELALSYLLYYPLVGTIFFSGILGCCNIPMLGGRPYEIHQEERRKQRQQQNHRSFR